MHEALTRWTIWLAMAAYVAVLASRIRTRSVDAADNSPSADSSRPANVRRERNQRGLWTLGCCLAWAHLASAFASYHHWSHDAAYAHTARETAAAVGIDWGGGIYFNYLFMLLWTTDAAWWWVFPASYRDRSRMYSILLDAYLAFMAFNATVVFGHGIIRYFGIAATVSLAWLASFGRIKGSPPA